MKRILMGVVYCCILSIGATAHAGETLSGWFSALGAGTTQQCYPSGQVQFTASWTGGPSKYVRTVELREDGALVSIEVSSDSMRHSSRTYFDDAGNPVSTDHLYEGFVIGSRDSDAVPAPVQMTDDLDVMSNPMAFKGKEITLRLRVMQIVNGGAILDMPWYPTDWDLAMRYYYGYGANLNDIVDGQVVTVRGTITGTYRYLTAMGATKTIPKMSIKEIR